jgi:lipopolysaccharide transport system ATP-binding protein
MYRRPQDRLKQSVVPRFQQMLGKPPTRYFREFWSLRNVSFEVGKGETVGVIGRNGSGKSTLLQLICGTLNPTTGTVSTQGRIAALLELGSGFNPEFSGRENVYLNGAILGLSREEIDARYDAIAGFADIGEFIEQPVKVYSSGMVVRLAFAVQAMVDPDILVVDEALAVGDEKFQRKCFSRIQELKNKGTSILFVSHSGPQIIELCDKALLLEQGERLLYKPPLQVIRAYHKLIYAPLDERKKLVQEYKAMDRLEEKDELNQEPEESAEPGEDTSVSASLDPHLTPKTTEVYPIQGAEIIAFQIFDGERRPVNMLRLGQTYQFEVSGRFLADQESVYFGIHIRTVSGVIISGQRYPENGNTVKRVQAGEGFRIKYEFNMDLVPGAYFVGGGVWSNQEPTCLHRIMDAIMFRVLPDHKSSSFGYVDLAGAEPVLEIF